MRQYGKMKHNSRAHAQIGAQGKSTGQNRLANVTARISRECYLYGDQTTRYFKPIVEKAIMFTYLCVYVRLLLHFCFFLLCGLLLSYIDSRVFSTSSLIVWLVVFCMWGEGSCIDIEYIYIGIYFVYAYADAYISYSIIFTYAFHRSDRSNH